MDVPGRPGTWTSLALRVAQSVSAGAAGVAMAAAYSASVNNYRSFWYLIYAMLFQLIWSLTLGCVDVYALRNQADLHSTALLRAFLVGDWVIVILSFSAASASAGVTTFFEIDTGACTLYKNELCSYYKMSVTLAFAAWSFQAASAAAIFCLNATM